MISSYPICTGRRQPVPQRPLMGNQGPAIYNRLATFTATSRKLEMGVDSLSSAERHGPPSRSSQWSTCLLQPAALCCRRQPFAAAVSESEWQQILVWWLKWLTHNNPTSCAQVSKRLVAYIKALLVFSPYERPYDLD